MLRKLTLFLFSILFLSSIARADLKELAPEATGREIGEQIEAIPKNPSSEEVNYVEESQTVRKMTQAEKAENAKKYDSFGGGITLIAMCIVVGALIILSILFYIFGNISSWFLLHKKKQTAKALNNENIKPGEDDTPDSGETIAAISAALAQHFSTDHDMQDTILTIRRMRKAYSPWNSKIYNMRHQPDIVHTHKKNR